MWSNDLGVRRPSGSRSWSRGIREELWAQTGGRRWCCSSCGGARGPLASVGVLVLLDAAGGLRFASQPQNGVSVRADARILVSSFLAT